MLAKLIIHIWSSRPRLSYNFWCCMLCLYTAALAVIISAFSPVADEILQMGVGKIELTSKIKYIRTTILCAGLTLIPFLLWKSLKYASNFMKLFATTGLLMYIDENLVLQDILHYPNTPVVQLGLLLRPIAIMAMGWMTFELHFRVENGL